MFLYVSVILSTGGVSVSCHFLSSCLMPCSFYRVSVPGPVFLSGGLCSGGLCPEGSVSRGISVWGSLSRGGLCPGGERGLSPGGLCRETPP